MRGLFGTCLASLFAVCLLADAASAQTNWDDTYFRGSHPDNREPSQYRAPAHPQNGYRAPQNTRQNDWGALPSTPSNPPSRPPSRTGNYQHGNFRQGDYRDRSHVRQANNTVPVTGQPAPSNVTHAAPTRTPVTTPATTRRLVQTPQPFQLSPQETDFCDRVLQYWEQRSSAITRYRCKFKRWEYDHVFGPKGQPNTARTISYGQVKYEADDKGMFKVDKMTHYEGPEKYVERAGEYGEHWICDGARIYEFDAKNKQLKEEELPPEMRGKAIADGPLPFLFGAKADTLKNRYWIRVMPPRDPNTVPDQYFIQAYPKTQQDAVNFEMVEVIFDSKQFLPVAMQVYHRGYDGRANYSRTAYTFSDRVTNEKFSLEDLNLFRRAFYNPSTPFGWKRIVKRYGQPDGIGEGVQAPQFQGRQASGQSRPYPQR